MDSNDLMLAGLLLMAAVSIGAVVFLLVNPYFSGERRTDKRIQGVTESKSRRLAIKAQADAVRTAAARSPRPCRNWRTARRRARRLPCGCACSGPASKFAARLLDREHGLRACCWGRIWLSAPNLPIIVPLLACSSAPSACRAGCSPG